MVLPVTLILTAYTPGLVEDPCTLWKCDPTATQNSATNRNQRQDGHMLHYPSKQISERQPAFLGLFFTAKYESMQSQPHAFTPKTYFYFKPADIPVALRYYTASLTPSAASTGLANALRLPTNNAFQKVPMLCPFFLLARATCRRTSVRSTDGRILTRDPKYLKKKLPQCHLVHHQSHTGWPGIEPGPYMAIHV